MVSSVELRRIAAFSNLPDDQISWFLSHVQEVPVRVGEAFVRQGEPADWMIIFLEGLFLMERRVRRRYCVTSSASW